MAPDAPHIISIAEAALEPYATVLSYPVPDESVLISRIRQLRELGVSEIEFTGRLRLGKLALLGKGVAGVVLSGRAGKDRIALKIRRTDSRRDSMRHEAAMLRAANKIHVGPQLYANTADIILMEFVEGLNLPEWIAALTGRGQRFRFRATVAEIFRQCFRLDCAGLDHGELSRAHRNVLIRKDGRPVILDFERASKDRVPHNLTSIAQYFYLGRGFAKRVRRIIGPQDEALLKRALQSYKSGKSPEAFQRVADLLKLELRA